MSEAELRTGWSAYEPPWMTIEPGCWGIWLDRGGAANQLGRYLTNFEGSLEDIDRKLRQIDEVVAGTNRPGWFGGDNDGGVAVGNGHVYIASDFDEADQLVVTVDVFRGAFQWLRDLVTHPDFTNPDADPLPPFVVEIVADGPGAADTYIELGGSFFSESSPSTDHLN